MTPQKMKKCAFFKKCILKRKLKALKLYTRKTKGFYWFRVTDKGVINA